MANPIWKTAPNKALKIIKPVVHVGFVPLILYIALKQEPDLTLWQILFPLASPSEGAMQ